MTTQKQVRKAFFEAHPAFSSEFRTRKTHNDYSCDCRYAFSMYVDHLCRDQQISQALVQRVTLG